MSSLLEIALFGGSQCIYWRMYLPLLSIYTLYMLFLNVGLYQSNYKTMFGSPQKKTFIACFIKIQKKSSKHFIPLSSLINHFRQRLWGSLQILIRLSWHGRFFSWTIVESPVFGGGGRGQDVSILLSDLLLCSRWQQFKSLICPRHACVLS